MEEIVTYIGAGLEDDKHGENSVGYSVSIHSNSVSYAYKNANAHPHGAVSTGFLGASNDKVIAGVKNKALLHVYVHGKEAPIQKIPVPEQLTSLTITNHSNNKSASNNSTNGSSSDEFLQLPWLLVAGSITGKLYVWELNSGNLLYNRSVHYQKINKIALSNNNNYIVTTSDDARVLVFRTLDIITAHQSQNFNIKPLHAITDHTLPVTGLQITSGLSSDLKLITASTDSTCRIYDLTTGKLQLTLVLSYPIHSLALDPAFRAVYLGLANATIREVKLYQVDPVTKKLYYIAEKASNKIITLEDDPDLKYSFLSHQQTEKSSTAKVHVSSLDVSFDGTILVSGDSLGKVLVSDIFTKQTLKALKPVNGAVTCLQLSTALSKDPNSGGSSSGGANLLGSKKSSNNYKTVPQLKRTIGNNSDLSHHEIQVQIPENQYSLRLKSNNQKQDYDFDEYLANVAAEEQVFSRLADGGDQQQQQNGGKTSVEAAAKESNEVAELKRKLEKITSAYSQLRGIHEELYEEHSKLLGSKD